MKDYTKSCNECTHRYNMCYFCDFSNPFSPKPYYGEAENCRHFKKRSK